MPGTPSITELHERAGALTAPWGESAVQVVQTFGDVGREYGAIRTRAALFDRPERAVLEVRGAERVGFLNRMLTQELKNIAPGQVVGSFWLNRKGRIDADLRVLAMPDRVLLELDVLSAAATAKGLDAFIISEDCSVKAPDEPLHRLSLHGPTGGVLLESLAGPEALKGLGVGEVRSVTLAGTPCVVFREDSAGEPGFEVLVPEHAARTVYERMIEAGHTRGDALARQVGLSPAGWLAYNVARIEAGTPIYNIDFGPESLPAETGLIEKRVSFTKGCYLGQEVVARMHARSQRKQALAGIKFQGGSGDAALPERGCLLAGAAPGEGVVTSSTLAPMLQSAPVAFAAVKPTLATPGTVLVATVGGQEIRGEVQPSLAFWARPGA